MTETPPVSTSPLIGGQGTSKIRPKAKEPNLDGLSCVAEGENPIVDIIAIHGLDGHYKESWAAENGVFWIRDLLPGDFPNTRIYSYGYDSLTRSSDKAVSRQTIQNHAAALVATVVSERQRTNTMRRPIIFIAHSLGGIVLKSALIHSTLTAPHHLPEYRSVKLSTAGILFMGTPQQGAKGVGALKLVVNILSLCKDTNTKVLENLKEHSQWLQQQNQQYLSISGEFQTIYFYETQKTRIMPFVAKWIVPHGSAVLPGSVNVESIHIGGDHSRMVKFISPEDRGYRKVSDGICRILDGAPAVVEGKWRDFDERQNLDQTPIKPDYNMMPKLGIPSTLLTGREDILRELHKLPIGDDNEQSHKRVIVSIHGMGGIRKSQVALRFAHLHKDFFSSIFWIDARDSQSIQANFLDCRDTYLSSRRLLKTPSSKLSSHCRAPTNAWLG